MNNNIVIFTCESNLREFDSVDTIHVDGTFKSSPRFFKQLFYIHILKNNAYSPLVFALLLDKSKTSYEAAFQALLAVAGTSCRMKPQIIYTDFEAVIHAPARSVPRIFEVVVSTLARRGGKILYKLVSRKYTRRRRMKKRSTRRMTMNG